MGRLQEVLDVVSVDKDGDNQILDRGYRSLVRLGVRLDKAHVWRGWFFLYPLFAELNGDCSSASFLP